MKKFLKLFLVTLFFLLTFFIFWQLTQNITLSGVLTILFLIGLYYVSWYVYAQVKSFYVATRNKLLEEKNIKNFPKINASKRLIEGIHIDELLNIHHSPLFIVSEVALKQKYSVFRKLLDKYYQNSHIAYSIKTNSLLSVCKLLKNEGAWAEVVSGFEYFLAKKKLGYSEKNIIYNGPYKESESLEHALRKRALVHIDNFEELHLINELAAKKRKQFLVGLRVSTTSNGLWPSRFGFNIEDSSATSAVQFIHNSTNLKLVGVHCHIGTDIKSPKYYEKTVKKVLEWVKIAGVTKLDYFDFGGGLPANSYQVQNYSWFAYQLEDYIRAITLALQEEKNKGTLLFLEPGRAIVDESTVLFSKVLHTKVLHGEQVITIDASVNILPLARWERLTPVALSNTENKTKFITKIYGPSCMESDCLGSEFRLALLKAGDLLVFYNVGAYNIAQGNQFIFPRPGVILIEKENTVKVLRKKETYEELIQREVV